MPLSGVISSTGVIVGGAVFGDVFILSLESGDLILQETSDKIIV